MRVKVDDDRCAGHGICLAVCPDVFTLTDDGYAEAEPSDVAADLGGAVTEAAQACPEHAITVD